MKIDYSEFKKMEECGNKRRKYSAREFILKLLEEKPYNKSEIEQMAEDANYIFNGNSDESIQARYALSDLVEEGLIEARFDEKGIVYYGLKNST